MKIPFPESCNVCGAKFILDLDEKSKTIRHICPECGAKWRLEIVVSDGPKFGRCWAIIGLHLEVN